MPESTPPNETTFADLGLCAGVLDTLAALGYEAPTPIQRRAIPVLLAGRDAMGSAATGTGKTAAFALPIVERLEAEVRGVQALILTPTRELAVQVAQAIHRYGEHRYVTVLPVYGGQSIVHQLRGLQRGVQVVVGTPGRLLDHLARGSLDLSGVRTVVLDEADEMLDMGFVDDIEAILDATPADRQTALFSATFPPRILALMNKYLRDPVRLQIKPPKHETPLVRQVVYVVPRAHKLDALERVLDVEDPRAAIIFCRTRTEVDAVADALAIRGFRPSALHGGLSQVQRDRVMGGFREGGAEIMVATDVAARGLDVEHVSHVINFDIPESAESYMHRIGRTARAGREGTAVTLVEPRERGQLRAIERQAGQQIEGARIPTGNELRARRQQHVAASVSEVIEAQDFDSWMVLVDSLAQHHDLREVAASALQLLASRAYREDAEDAADIPEWEPRYERPRPAPVMRAGRASDGTRMTRLFINVGSMAGIRPSDLVGAIAGEARVPGKAIGAITIGDRYSVIEVVADVADKIIRAMEKATVKGRSVRIERYRER